MRYGPKEEGEEEYAAYHPSSKAAGEQLYTEEGMLYQPLGTEEGADKVDSHSVPLCDQDRTATACASNVLSLGEFLGSVGRVAEGIGKWEQKTIHRVWKGIKRALGYRNPTGHTAACAAFGVGVNLVLKDSPFATTNAVGVAAAIGCASFFN